MQSLDYIGCKNRLFPTILDVVKRGIPNLSQRYFADLFAGTGTVGYKIQDYVKSVIACDLEYYSFIINYALLKSNYSDKLETIIREFNSLDTTSVVSGLIEQNFSPTGSAQRLFFTSRNANIGDQIRQTIELKHKNGELDYDEYVFLVASLLISIDKVSNTSCVYGAYLKKFKASSLKKIEMKPIHMRRDISNCNEVYHNNILDLIVDKEFDVVYLDPPYNSRQYSSNYSPLNYIAYYNSETVIRGKTGIMMGNNISTFCQKRKVKQSFETLIENIKCNYLILSYNNEGLLTESELKDILTTMGSVCLYKIIYNKFKAQKKIAGTKVTEYIWIVDYNGSKGLFEIKQLDNSINSTGSYQ